MLLVLDRRPRRSGSPCCACLWTTWQGTAGRLKATVERMIEGCRLVRGLGIDDGGNLPQARNERCTHSVGFAWAKRSRMARMLPSLDLSKSATAALMSSLELGSR